jgi:hypothetical protein
MPSITRDTRAFTLTIGVTPGYGHANEQADGAVDRVARLWQELMAEEAAASGTYAPALVGRADWLCLYAAEHGCPPGGEVVVVVRGVRNPKFLPDEGAWLRTVATVVLRLKARLGQTTAHLEWSDVKLTYFHEGTVS